MSHLDFLKVHGFDKKCRLGANADGGYVVAELDGGYDCYVSAGVGNEESFSRDFIQKYGMTKEINFALDASDAPENGPTSIQATSTILRG